MSALQHAFPAKSQSRLAFMAIKCVQRALADNLQAFTLHHGRPWDDLRLHRDMALASAASCICYHGRVELSQPAATLMDAAGAILILVSRCFTAAKLFP
jgi:hypothetical protein